MTEKKVNANDLAGAVAILCKLELDATPGPWTAIGCELYYGQEVSGSRHQQLVKAEDARFIAVMRNWIKDILNDYQQLKDRISEENMVQAGILDIL